MSKPTAGELRNTASLLEQFADVLERKNLQGTGEHIALTESAKFFRSLVRDSEPAYVQGRNRGNVDHRAPLIPRDAPHPDDQPSDPTRRSED